MGGQRIPLTPKALGVLQYLVSRPGRLVAKQELLEAKAWGGPVGIDERRRRGLTIRSFGSGGRLTSGWARARARLQR